MKQLCKWIEKNVEKLTFESFNLQEYLDVDILLGEKYTSYICDILFIFLFIGLINTFSYSFYLVMILY